MVYLETDGALDLISSLRFYSTYASQSEGQGSYVLTNLLIAISRQNLSLNFSGAYNNLKQLTS